MEITHNLGKLADFSHRLQQAIIKKAEVHTIVECLKSFTSYTSLYLSITEASLCIPAEGEPGAGEELLREAEALVDRQPPTGRKPTRLTLPSGTVVVLQPVLGLGHVLSYIGLAAQASAMTEEDSLYIDLLLDYAGRTAEQLLLRKLVLDDRMSEGHATLVHGILFGDIPHEDQMLAQIGLPSLSTGHYLFVSGTVILDRSGQREESFSAKGPNQDILMLLRSLLSTHGIYNLLLLHNNVIHLLCIRETFGNRQAQWEKVKQSLRKVTELLMKSSRLRPEESLRIHAGFGHVKSSLREAAQSYREALDAVAITRMLEEKPSGSAFYEDMGIYQMLKSIGDTDQLIRFVQNHLGPLLAYEQSGGLALVHTLDHYLSCMGSKQETAERLFIHRQTLYHRLDKLDELLGPDYLRPERRLCLEIAIRAYDLVKDEMKAERAI
ncbi:putative PucR family transcriptional regulator [Paenibacillus sp. 598K]|uniref:PucR family transcriptional regulator n=1 Tax=Paenibacillus sp. 598K TaxID=1117987 RepID=UPI000FF914A4|nr:helix-turn-helix domain-containing protein [Paenibacillus sp. 598K]GBF72466.1 putative PucR family transcriptional regulator [Paenibacillus sp. 598K]